MLDKVIAALEPVHDALCEIRRNKGVLTLGLKDAFTGASSRWRATQLQAVVSCFSPTMLEAYESDFKGKWPQTMCHAFMDEPLKLYSHLNLNIVHFKAGGELHENFVEGTMKALIRARMNIPVVLENYKLLGAERDARVEEGIRFFSECLLPAIDRAAIEIGAIAGYGSIDLARIESEAERARYEGVETMMVLLPESLFPRSSPEIGLNSL